MNLLYWVWMPYRVENVWLRVRLSSGLEYWAIRQEVWDWIGNKADSWDLSEEQGSTGKHFMFASADKALMFKLTWGGA